MQLTISSSVKVQLITESVVLLRVTKAILNNENSVLTVSAYAKVNTVKRCLRRCSAVINREGVREIVELELNEDEKAKFAHSVKVLKKQWHQYYNNNC